MMGKKIFIDLDKEKKLPPTMSNQDIVDIKINGKLIVKNSILENIDTLTKEELRYILTNLKNYIYPTVTSQYIPSVDTMRILFELAPTFKVRFKTEKDGADPIIPISIEEFFEGEKIFDEILKGIDPQWSELQKYKYLYNKNSQMLSYDLNALSYTSYGRLHEKYSRNIFTAMAKNWGICASFAASYDYLCYRAGLESQVLSEENHDYVVIEHTKLGNILTDSTSDATRVKFGMKSRSFGVSKKQFIEDGHHLEETEASDYEFHSLCDEEIRQLDCAVGYLQEFKGEYTDTYIINLANHIEGNNNFEKITILLEKIKNLKTIGRPSTCDFERIISLILANTHDKALRDGIKVYSHVSENISELPNQIIIEVHDARIGENVEYFVLKDGLESYEVMYELEENNYKRI